MLIINSADLFSQDSTLKKSYLDKNVDYWKYQLTAGTWMSAMKGDVSANELYGYVSNNIDNTYNGADFSFYGEFEARKDRLTYFGQFSYLYQSDKFNYDKDTLYSRSIVTSRPLFVTANISYEFYRNNEVAFDLYGGVRLNMFRNKIENFYKTLGSIEQQESIWFLDPLIGTKFFYIPFKKKDLSRLYVKGNFDVGGFGLVSFLAFQSYLGAGYKLNNYLDLNLGYRYIDVHYGTETYLYDAGIQGFEITASTKF